MDRESVQRLLSKGIVILVVALLMWVFAQRRASSEAVVAQDEVLKVAVDLSPNGLRVGEQGGLSGLQKELLDLLLPSIKKELVAYTNRRDAIEDLKKGEVHLYATSIPFSPKVHSADIQMTEWLYQSRYALVYREEGAEWSEYFSQPNTSVVVSSEDQVAVIILKNLIELSYPTLSIDEREQSPLELGMELSKGNISYLMCDTDIAESIVGTDTTLQLSHDLGFELRQVWLLNSKEDSLRQSLDSAIVALRGSEEWLKIINCK